MTDLVELWEDLNMTRLLWTVWKEQGVWKVQMPKGIVSFKTRKAADDFATKNALAYVK